MNAKDEPTKGFDRDTRVERRAADDVSATSSSAVGMQLQPDHPIRSIELFAWLGVDELGSGEIGLKQIWAPGARIPLAAVKRYKMEAPAIVDAMRRQAEAYGKKIRLCRFVFAEVVSETPIGTDIP